MEVMEAMEEMELDTEAMEIPVTEAGKCSFHILSVHFSV